MNIEVGKEGFCRMSNPFISKEEHAYWEGVALRQAEIDELKETVSDQLIRIGQLENEIKSLKDGVNKEREEATEYFTDLEYANAKCKELQKRIDKLIPLLERYNYVGWTRILKGTQNEN